MAPLRLALCLLTLTSLGLVLLSNANTAVALNLLGFTSRSLPLSLWMLAALGSGLALSFFFEGLFALTRWQPRNLRDPRDLGPGPRPRGGYAEDDEFVEENFSVPQRDRYSRPDPEAPWDDPNWVEADRGTSDPAYESDPYDYRGDQNRGNQNRDDDRTYDKRDYNQRTYGDGYDDGYDDRPNDRPMDRDSRSDDNYQPRPFSAKPKDRPIEPPIVGEASRSENRPDRPNQIYDADFRILDDNNPRPEPRPEPRRAQAEPPRSPKPEDDWGDWNDNDPDW
jgi:hypothetical protein